ncbi:hypothetical protein GCM10010458_28280 [Microbacterium luteolum]|uniref:Discoidin domain-containing protein n=1 Tax=Microbacterium luteolum TaxID=69367 RepID=A0ABY7XI35_MICLT|nr:discoidin domain-containing protein [Microbacterium luteolum]WDM41755.1 discoidin domain-containing protein [Microbacterium luteolum]
MNIRRRRRLLLALTAVVALAGAQFASSPPLTDASWIDSEQSRASFSALTVPSPAASPCTTRNGALGVNRVTLSWRVPAGVTGYSSTNAEFGQRTNQGAYETISANSVTTISTTGSASAYSTEISGAPLGGSLGDKRTFAVRFSGPGGWKSGWVDACTFDVVRSRILPSQITVTASSEELVREFAPATYANDDNAATGWVSRWATQPTTVFPHILTFDLGRQQSVDGIGYLSRAFTNAMIKAYTVELSGDGQTYTTVASGEWQQTTAWQFANFAPQTARYVRVTALSSTSGTAWAAALEMPVFGTPTP